jgi:hypothetical protein
MSTLSRALAQSGSYERGSREIEREIKRGEYRSPAVEAAHLKEVV